VTVSLLRRVPAVCGHCDRSDVGVFAAGYGALGGVPLCHPNVAGRPDCYRLVTVFGHPMACRCEERSHPVVRPRSPTT
jgi:hypothetical protein